MKTIFNFKDNSEWARNLLWSWSLNNVRVSHNHTNSKTEQSNAK